MSFFSEQYQDFRWPLAIQDNPGFRIPQAGALHAIAAHFTRKSTPAIVSMPTGSGKTAVLMSTPFVLRANRVLVITPSRLVREQIVSQFSQLDPLRVMGVIDRRLPLPNVWSADRQITTREAWDALRKYDVVIGTPQSLSPANKGISAPPPDLFDLVLIDEAHHSPARTWAELADQFTSSYRVLFTATPFRSDRREIVGDFIYSYDLRNAYADGVFGKLEYIPILADEGVDPDVAIAKKTEETFLSDKANGLKHLVMVRTGSKLRAKELAKLYREHTNLRLKPITSDQTLIHVKHVIESLRDDKLDGVICVDMLGEGFDLPALKIAALHSPHRSLAVTLQFIGRFARTNASNIGRAAFIAAVSDMQIEREKLYDEEAAWEEIIPRLSQMRISNEEVAQQTLSSFGRANTERPEGQADQLEFDNVSIHSLWPYHHAKIYRIVDSASVQLDKVINLPVGFEEVYRRSSDSFRSVVLVLRSRVNPEFSEHPAFTSPVYDIVVMYFHEQSRLLFIHTSNRTDGFYPELAKEVVVGQFRSLSLSRLNKALLNLEKPEFFNIGMRNRILSSTTETYRIVSGGNAAAVLQQSDGRLYHRGHFFGRGEQDGALVTLGLSAGSKIWSNRYDRISTLIDWFKRVAERTMSVNAPRTNSGLDYLSTGREIDSIPENIVSAEWDQGVYANPPMVEWISMTGETKVASLLDADLNIAYDRSTEDRIAVDISFDDVTYGISFSYSTDTYFTEEAGTPKVRTVSARSKSALVNYINEHPLSFYTADLARVCESDLFEASDYTGTTFDVDGIEAIDWTAANVDIESEVTCDKAGSLSIHDHLKLILPKSGPDVVFYDHGKGELADFITVTKEANKSRVCFYHCKASDKSKPGKRLDDVYEVCCQAIKSIVWYRDKHVRDAIQYRLKTRPGRSHFVSERGSLDTVIQLLDGTKGRVEFATVIVQPGISKGNLKPEVLTLFAATNDYLVRGGCLPLSVLSSR